MLVIDEGLSQISAEYLPGTKEFLKTLAHERGFKFLLVCHDPRIIKHADYTFEMTMGSLKEVDNNLGEFWFE